MLPDISVTPLERTAEAELLFARAADGEVVDLMPLYAMELCVLGAPKQVVCEDDVAVAWEDLGGRKRKKAHEAVTQGLVKRNLLAASEESGAGRPDSYVLAPSLAIAMAARCRPTYLVLTEVVNRTMRTPRFFAIGDEDEPVRGIVLEDPAALPAGAGDFPHLRKLGALGRFYRYTLISPETAADLLARWAISPVPPKPGADAGPDAGAEPGSAAWSPRLTSCYWRSLKPEHMGGRITSEGDGEMAKLFALDGADGIEVAAEVDLDGMRDAMADLLARGVR